MAHPDCYEAIAGLHEALQSALPEGHTYFVMGGIVTAAMIHPDSQVQYETKTVEATQDSAIPFLRDNETVRDVDVLIDKILTDEEAEEYKQVIIKNTGGLEASVFGFEAHDEEETAKSRAMKSASKWISERTIDANGVKRIELHPFSRVLSDGVFEPWTLKMPGGYRVNQFNPVGHYLAYRTRSISGVRYKDIIKDEQMSAVVYGDDNLLTDLHSGPFEPLNAFANDLLIARITKIPASEYANLEATRAELAAFRWKGQLLRALESNERIIKVAQTPVGAKLLSPFTHAS